jgi:hypothetical protein
MQLSFLSVQLFSPATNKIELTKFCRADDTLYNFIKFDNKHNVKPSDFTETNEYKIKFNKVHICYTNKKGKEINHIKMQEVYKNNRCKTGLKLNGLS